MQNLRYVLYLFTCSYGGQATNISPPFCCWKVQYFHERILGFHVRRFHSGHFVKYLGGGTNLDCHHRMTFCRLSSLTYWYSVVK